MSAAPDEAVFGPYSDGEPVRPDEDMTFAEFLADIDREIAGDG